MPRRFTGQRTPRRRKIWAEVHSTTNIPTTIPFVVVNLLASLEADIGVSYMTGVTVMGLRGAVWIAENSNATTPAIVAVHLGFAWVPQAIAAASGGDSQIPEPGQAGIREDRWYQENTIYGLENSSATDYAPASLGSSFAYERWDVETRNMQKQPQANYQFCLIATTGGNQESNTLQVNHDLVVLLALP